MKTYLKLLIALLIMGAVTSCEMSISGVTLEDKEKTFMTITSVTPSKVKYLDTVTVTGEKFTSTTYIVVSRVEAKTTFVSADSLVFIMPKISNNQEICYILARDTNNNGISNIFEVDFIPANTDH